MGKLGRLIALAAVTCAVLGAYNVYAASPGLESVAREQACGTARPPSAHAAGQPNCRAALRMVRRSPFKQTYLFSTGAAQVQVDCTRAFVLVGDYSCARQPGN